MKSCVNTRTILEFVNRELSADSMKKVAKHLQECGECEDELRFLKLVIAKQAAGEPGYPPVAATGEHVSLEAVCAYFEGTASEGEIEHLHSHVIACTDCLELFTPAPRWALEAIPKELKPELARIDKTPIRDRTEPYKRVFRAAPDESDSRTRWRRLIRKGLVPALVMALIAVSLLFWMSKGDSLQKALAYGAQRVQAVQVSPGDLRPVGGARFTPVGLLKGSASGSPDLTVLTSALEKYPQSARLHHQIATLLFFDGQVDSAEFHYRKALALAGDEAEINNDLALVYTYREEYEQALTALESALRINPDLLEARYNLAVVYEFLGDTRNAIAAWNAYLSADLDPESKWADIAHDQLERLTAKP